MAGKDIAIGGQDCHAEPSGAFTGDISAEMLKDAGATSVIVGHSERRQYHGETDAAVAAKARAAWRAGLNAIICIGETDAQREQGDALTVCASQLLASIPNGATPRDTTIAYEPVWAIGTGQTPTPAEIVEVHALIRNHLTTRFGESGREMRILYGGSVKPANACEILSLAERRWGAGRRREPEGRGLPGHRQRRVRAVRNGRYRSLTDRVAICATGKCCASPDDQALLRHRRSAAV